MSDFKIDKRGGGMNYPSGWYWFIVSWCVYWGWDLAKATDSFAARLLEAFLAK